MIDFRYRGRTSGRVHLFILASLQVTESLTPVFLIEDGNVFKDGVKFATYTWEEDSDIPVFELEPNFKHLETCFAEGKEFVLEAEYLLGRKPWSEAEFQRRMHGENIVDFQKQS